MFKINRQMSGFKKGFFNTSLTDKIQVRARGGRSYNQRIIYKQLTDFFNFTNVTHVVLLKVNPTFCGFFTSQKRKEYKYQKPGSSSNCLQS